MAGAHLVCMRGVALYPAHWFPNLPTTVTEQSALEVMRLYPEQCTKINKASATEMGKTDGLGKTIVCSQVLWMIVQCITRKASGLPVTLRERHVAMHVICALIMYGLWWDKPHNVSAQLVLNESRDGGCAVVLQSAGFELSWVDIPSPAQETPQPQPGPVQISSHESLGISIPLVYDLGFRFQSAKP